MPFALDFIIIFYLCHVFMYFYVYCNISFINLKPKYYSSKSITFFYKDKTLAVEPRILSLLNKKIFYFYKINIH